MKKTVVIHQPDFIPYLGFFHRFLNADLYIALDHVQFVYGSRSWTNRDKIKTSNGEKWLTVSTKKSPRGMPINEIELSSDVDWKERNLGLIEGNYKKAPFYNEIMLEVNKLYADTSKTLSEFNIKSIELLMCLLDIQIPCVLSSTLEPVGNKNELLIDLLKKVNASHYLSGIGAKAYLDEEQFINAGIQVVWQEFKHPVYKQLYGDFIPYLTSLDMLFNCGVEESRKLLRGK